MKSKEAMYDQDKEIFEHTVMEEHERIEKYKIWKSVSKKEVPKNDKVVTVRS